MALVSEYSFNEANGSSTTVDLTGNGYDLTAVGSPFAADGREGNGARGGTTTDRIEGSVGPNSFFTEWTVMAWVKLDSYTPLWRAILSDGSNFYFEFSAQNGVNQPLNIECYSGASNSPSGPTGYTTVTGLGVWMHVAVTRSAGSDYFGDGPSAVFLNGVHIASGKGRAYRFSNPNFEIGSCNDGTGYNLDGVIDNLRVFDEALTEAQITAWMNTPAGAKPPVLLAAYAFNEADGATTIADASGNGIVATTSGVSFTDGPLANTRAVSFSSTGQYVEIPRSGTEPATTGVTVMCWGKGPVDVGYVVKSRDGGGSTRLAVGPNWRARWKDDLHFTDSGSSVDTSQWHHYCVIDADDQWVILIDGVLYAGGARSFTDATPATWDNWPWRIGQTPSTLLGDSRNGQMIAEVRIFQGALYSNDQVQFYMNTPVLPWGRKFRLGGAFKRLKLGPDEKRFGSS